MTLLPNYSESIFSRDDGAPDNDPSKPGCDSHLRRLVAPRAKPDSIYPRSATTALNPLAPVEQNRNVEVYQDKALLLIGVEATAHEGVAHELASSSADDIRRLSDCLHHFETQLAEVDSDDPSVPQVEASIELSRSLLKEAEDNFTRWHEPVFDLKPWAPNPASVPSPTEDAVAAGAFSLEDNQAIWNTLDAKSKADRERLERRAAEIESGKRKWLWPADDVEED